MLRDVAQAFAPFLFGFVSEQIGSGRASPGAAHGFGAGASSQGLEYTLLIMLTTLLLSGLIMVRARRTYPRDVATAISSDTGAD